MTVFKEKIQDTGVSFVSEVCCCRRKQAANILAEEKPKQAFRCVHGV